MELLFSNSGVSENNVIDSNRTQELLNLINSQDIKDIKMFLGL